MQLASIVNKCIIRRTCKYAIHNFISIYLSIWYIYPLFSDVILMIELWIFLGG